MTKKNKNASDRLNFEALKDQIKKLNKQLVKRKNKKG